MNLEEGLGKIAEYFGLNHQELIDYANEDDIGGFHFDESQRKWNMGSLWGVDGQVLYAYIRATKPKRVIEIGTSEGASATHILTALEKNGDGQLTSIDIWAGAGTKVPQNLRHRWEFIAADAVKWLAETTDQSQGTARCDMIFEDGPHDFETTKNIILEALNFYPNAIFSHDAAHFLVGKDVLAGFEAAVEDTVPTILVEPSDCGLGFWKP